MVRTGWKHRALLMGRYGPPHTKTVDGASMTAAIITTIGLVCDIIGALLVANEVVRVFRGPTTIDIGGSGSINGGFIPKPNPAFEAHEIRKRRTMKVGLGFLVIGFVLQGVAAWWQIVGAT